MSSSTTETVIPVSKLPELESLLAVFESEDEAIEYLSGRGLNITHDYCVRCGEPNPRAINKREKRYLRCRKQGCDYNFSVFKDSFFSNSRLNVNKILEIAYFWMQGLDLKELTVKCVVNRNTVMEWTRRLRCLLVHDIEKCGEQERIGGDGVIVEVDESQRTRLPTGSWVVGGVERGKEMRMFAIIVDKRSAVGMRQVLESRLCPGSVVYTDSWKRYDNEELATVGLVRDETSRDIGFLDPITGGIADYTQTGWGDFSIRICRHHRTRGFVQGDLLLHIWRRQRVAEDHWERLVAAMCRFKGEHDLEDAGSAEALVQAELIASAVRMFAPKRYRRSDS